MEIYEQINDYSNGWSQFSGQFNKLQRRLTKFLQHWSRTTGTGHTTPPLSPAILTICVLCYFRDKSMDYF